MRGPDMTEPEGRAGLTARLRNPKCPHCSHTAIKVGGGRGWWWCDICRRHFERKKAK